MRYPLSANCVMLRLQIYEWSFSGSAPKSPHVVGFTRTKSPGFLCIKWFNIAAAYHFNTITIKAHSASINRDWSDSRLSPTTGKSQVWWRAFGQKIQSKATLGGRSGLLLIVLAQTERQHISRTVAATPSVPHTRPANRAVPLSLERTTLLHSVILSNSCGRALCSALPLYI